MPGVTLDVAVRTLFKVKVPEGARQGGGGGGEALNDPHARFVPDTKGEIEYEVTLHNPTNHVALMAHLQLRKKRSGKRVLPVFYSDNYVSLLPGGSKTITIEAAKDDLAGEPPLITLDGWNVRVGKVSGGVPVRENVAMRPGPVIPAPPVIPNPPGVLYQITCGQDDLSGTAWVGDDSYVRGGNPNAQLGDVDLSPAGDKAGPRALYNSERYGRMTYVLPVQAGGKYIVRLHFAELSQLAPGARKFNVTVNGQRVLSDFDIFTEAGGAGKLLIKEFPVEMASPGNIVIGFTRGSANDPEVRAIQVLSASR